MSTIYDNDDIMNVSRKGKTEPQPKKEPAIQPIPVKKEYAVPDRNEKEIASLQDRSANALELVDDVVLKNYLSKLKQMELVPLKEEPKYDNIILFKINKMVYEKDEYATDKFISVVSAMTYTNSSIYLIVDGHENHTDFYLGIKCDDVDRIASSVAETLKDSLQGQFPGVEFSDMSLKEKDVKFSKEELLLNGFKEATAYSCYSGIPAYKNSKGEYTNASFIQGIEKFATAMQGKRYTAIVLATNLPAKEIVDIRTGYENIYTGLSSTATQQLAYSTNESLANAVSRSKGYTDSTTRSHTEGTSYSETVTKTKGTSVNEDNTAGKAAKIGGSLMTAGAILLGTGAAAPLGVLALGAGAISSVVGNAKAKQLGKNESQSDGKTQGTNESDGTSVGHTDSITETDGTTSTVGSSKNFTITVQNKHIQDVLKRIDRQLERIELCESTGLWSTGTYFLSYDTNHAIAEVAATVFRSIMQGDQSGVETSAINSWYSGSKGDDCQNLSRYIRSLSHPVFSYNNDVLSNDMLLSPSSLLSSKEVAMMIGLPRKSVPGLPVIDHVSLAKEVVRPDQKEKNRQLKLGTIFDQGKILEGNEVGLDVKSLAQHTLVVGSTGCGKSNTIYYLIDQVRDGKSVSDPKFLIIEPAKGEYKDVFGNEHVYGTNPLRSKLLKVNPFRFPKGVHVLEHIDRLTEIFNVCWPMYAAMPAVLKDAMLNAYEDCGWDLYKSSNKYSDEVFPTFADLLNELVLVIENSAYSEEVKSNYKGSLVTRVKSLAVGINKQIFCGNELGDEKLFDENVIVDLSRIGSQETKSLIMGILIMRLNEYRANSGIEANSDLRHVTILEEAHNILKRCSTQQSMEDSNVAGKSVEMISNSIAEMRTYGEGFIIVDQSPSAIDISAIRNTNTKIIMRLPEESDRKVAGKSAAMKDYQIDEIAKLPTGVAVVYQNDWEAPVLCQIAEFKGERIKYVEESELKDEECDDKLRIEVLKLLLKGRINGNVEPDILAIKEGLNRSSFSTFNKITIFEALKEYDEYGEIRLWKDTEFRSLSQIVSQIVPLGQEVRELADAPNQSFEKFDENLTKLVQSEMPELPNTLDLSVKQCLMCDYVQDDETRKMIYNAWFQTVCNKIM